jgi:hypothetical protein
MTCPKCGSVIKIPKDHISVETEGYTVRVYVIGICEFCEYITHLACEAELVTQ